VNFRVSPEYIGMNLEMCGLLASSSPFRRSEAMIRSGQ
jgi:hypothetical protein